MKKSDPACGFVRTGMPWIRIGAVLLLSLIALQCALIFFIASRLKIDYFDSYETFINARYLAGISSGFPFSWKRPLFLALAASPFFAAEDAGRIPNLGWLATHFISAGCFALLAWAAYRLLRIHFDKGRSLWGCFILAMNPLVIHYAPFAKEDVASTLLVTASFYFYLRVRQSGRLKDYLLGCLSVSAAFASRLNILPLMSAFFLCYEAVRGACGLRDPARQKTAWMPLARRFAAFFLGPLIAFGLTLSWAYWRVGLSGFLQAPGVYLQNLRVWGILNDSFAPAGHNLIFLAKTLSFPLCILGLAGFYAGVRHRMAGTFFHALWISLFLAVQSLLVPVKESRLLMPILPSCCFFIVTGAYVVMDCLKSGRGRTIPVCLKTAGAAGLAGFLLSGAARESFKFTDPVYRTPFYEQVAAYAGPLAGQGRIAWLGHYYTIHPREYLFDRRDPFFYVYHGYNHIISFYTRKMVNAYFDAEYFEPGTSPRAVFAGPQLGASFQEGDVLIFNFEPQTYTTENAPDYLAPLAVGKVRETVFPAPETVEPGAPAVYPAQTPGDGIIQFRSDEHGFSLSGRNIPDGRYDLVCTLEPGAQKIPAGTIDVRRGEFEFKVGREGLPLAFSKITLFYIDSIRVFSNPGTAGRSAASA